MASISDYSEEDLREALQRYSSTQKLAVIVMQQCAQSSAFGGYYLFIYVLFI
jgi:hypothetical protein